MLLFLFNINYKIDIIILSNDNIKNKYELLYSPDCKFN